MVPINWFVVLIPESEHEPELEGGDHDGDGGRQEGAVEPDAEVEVGGGARSTFVDWSGLGSDTTAARVWL